MRLTLNDVRSLTKDLDTFTPCVITIGNAIQEKNYRRLEHLIVKIIRTARQHFVIQQQEKTVEALQFAAQQHKGVYRKDKFTPYLLHVLETVCILIDKGLFDYKVTIAAIIHDVVEDTGATIKEIQHLFGYAIARIVDLLSKEDNFFMRLGYWWFMKYERDKNIRWRVIVIKFADRIHNLMTLGPMSEVQREHKIEETSQEFPALHKVLAKTLEALRRDETLQKDKYIHLPDSLLNSLNYQIEQYQ